MRRVGEHPRDVDDLLNKNFIILSPVPEFEVQNEGIAIRQLHSEARRDKAVDQAQAIIAPTKEQDPDEIWRAFVFGSDKMDEIDRTSKPVSSLGFDGQALTTSSMLGKPPLAISDESTTHTAQRYQNTPDHSDSTLKSHTPSTTASNADSSSNEIPWNPPTGVPSTRKRSTRDGFIDLKASNGSQNLSLSDRVLPSNEPTSSSKSEHGTISMAVIASSRSGKLKSSKSPPSPSPRPQKVVFTKPRRYKGIKSASELSHAEEEPLHIGRGLARKSIERLRRRKE
jgi:hypothetical protein